MTRKLLPYEHQLVEALGITKEEYLEFVAVQQEYKDPKVGTALDIRNTGVEPGVVALVLTIVGTVAQVAAALLLKPDIPGARAARRTRQQRFAPSYGFNSAQELASYGDPVNLVYTQKSSSFNPEGGVRVGGSLVWSSIDNYGSTQFMRLMMVLGAAAIKEIDPDKTAFGQLPLKSLNPGLAWVFYNENNTNGKDGGAVRFSDKISGQKNLFPKDLERDGDFFVCRVRGANKVGFSQAYSPTAATSFGVFDPIPVNVLTFSRDDEGEEKDAPIGIQLKNDRYTTGSFFEPEETIELRFRGSIYDAGDKEARGIGLDIRGQGVEALDFGSTYMLGAGVFRLKEYSMGSHQDIYQGEVRAVFECIERGAVPSAPYGEKEPKNHTNLKTSKQDVIRAREILTDSDDKRKVITADKMVAGVKYEILTTGSTNFRNFGAPINNIGTRFTASRAGSGTGTVEFVDGAEGDELLINDIKLHLPAVGLSLSYEGVKRVEWKDILQEAGVSKDKKNRTFDFRRGGSLEHTKDLLSAFLADKPKLKTKDVKEAYDENIKLLEDELEDIKEGDYDKDTSKALGRGIRDLMDLDKARTSEEWPPYTYGWKELFEIKDDHPLFSQPTIGMLNGQIDRLRHQKRASIQRINVVPPVKLDALVGEPEEVTPGLERDQRKFVNEDDEIELEQLLDSEIEDIKEAKQARREMIKTLWRRVVIRQFKRTVGVFKSIYSGNTYLSGFRDMKNEREDLPGTKYVTDQIGVEKVKAEMKAVIKSKRRAIRVIESILKNWEDYVESLDNNFFVKCLVKSEIATYETVSPVDTVVFSIKGRLFRRISGRDKKYGEEKAPKGYKFTDNGVKGRMAFFRVEYKADGAKSYTTFPILFAMRHGADPAFYAQLRFNATAGSYNRYSFRFKPVYDFAAEFSTKSQTGFAFIETTDREENHSYNGVTFTWKGRKNVKKTAWGAPDLPERGPKLINEWDMFSVNTDAQIQFSHESGPEFSITAVTEQQVNKVKFQDSYKNMSILGVCVNAGRGVQDLRNITTFVTEGKRSYRVDNFSKPANGSTCFAPDIFVDTVLDKTHGVGRYTDSAALDQDSLKLAKRFCEFNNLPVSGDRIKLCMDGVIADASSWRSFWAENAPFSLLELARKNGADTLVPAIPCKNNGEAAESDGRPIAFTPSALFTTGNILEGSYKEEFLDYGAATQNLIASVIYRDQSGDDVFATNKTVEVRRRGVQDVDAIRQTFDVSQFVTQKQQAILFGKFLVNQRKWIRKAIEFRTFPSEAAIEPGGFIYVDIGMKVWDKYSTGVVMKDKVLNVPIKQAIKNDTYSFLFYDVKTGSTDSGSYAVSGGKASTIPDRNIGRMFVMGKAKPSKRVYRITEVGIEEDGEVSVKAIEYPCFLSGGLTRARIADFRSTNFTVR